MVLHRDIPRFRPCDDTIERGIGFVRLGQVQGMDTDRIVGKELIDDVAAVQGDDIVEKGFFLFIVFGIIHTAHYSNLHGKMRYTYIMTFPDLLRTYRSQNNLTQNDMAFELAAYSDAFEALSPVTVSRWENGTITPSFEKKRLIFKFFSKTACLDHPVCYEKIRSKFHQLPEPLSKVFEHNYKSLVGNLPRLKIPLHMYEIERLDAQSDIHTFELICEIERASEVEGYYDTTPIRLRAWCDHPDTFALACRYKGQHLGHFIMLKLDNGVADTLVHGRHHEHSIGETELCGEKTNGSYYVNALFGNTPVVAALLNTHAYLYMLEHRKHIDDIVIFSTRKDGLRITRPYGISIVDSGRFDDYGITWHGMRSPVEDILFSDLILKLLF